MLTLLAVISLVSLSSCTSNESCPTWLYRSAEGWCTCGSSLLNVILCSNGTQEVSILPSFCLTSSGSDQDPDDRVVVGGCLYEQNHLHKTDGGAGAYIRVNQNISKQDQELCGYLNREGQLCGICKPNHFVSVYSYDFKCYQCHRSFLSNVVMYLTVAYLPLTAFLVLVLAFHISVASPRLHMAVLLCQIYTLPEIQRVFTQNTRDTQTSVFINLMATLYGVWNLDFFRTLIPPICLPLNAMQVIALDYLLALFPLVLLVCFYGLVVAHDKEYKLVLKMWRPFLWCSARMRQQWNVRHSIIDAFATFILLSYMKFLNTSIDLMIATEVFDIHGAHIGYFLYYDATVEFMGSHHLPYAILAMVVFSLGLTFPLILLLYPMKCFQKLLNKCRLNSPALRAFMECFQGNYRDRTDGGWECRYFSTIYPIFRIGVSLTYALTRNDLFFPLMQIVIVGVIIILQVVHPYKKQYSKYKTMDTLLLLSLIGFTSGFLIHEMSLDWSQLCSKMCPTIGITVAAAFGLTPLFYFMVLMYRVQVRKPLQRCKNRFGHVSWSRRSYEDIHVARVLFDSASTTNYGSINH